MADAYEEASTMSEDTCSVPNCDRDDSLRRGMCKKHYSRWWRHGDPLHVERIVGDDERRFWEKVDKSSDCWEWTAALNAAGYGVFMLPKTLVRAHRWAYEQTMGPIPTGLQLDHLCRNRACVNPAHLEAVTQRVNIQRGAAASRPTHCRRGHEFTPENTYRPPSGQRVCRTCKRASDRKARLRAKGAL